MPKQVPPYRIGLFDGYVYYRIGDKYYIRKHVVSGKRKNKSAKSPMSIWKALTTPVGNEPTAGIVESMVQERYERIVKDRR